MKFIGNPTTTVILLLTIIQTAVILGAAIVVTRRSRRNRAAGLGWLAVGFWLIIASIALSMIAVVIGAVLVTSSTSSPLSVIRYIDDAFLIGERLTQMFGFLALAYGATRMRGRRFGLRSEQSIRPELEELGVPRALRRVQRLGRWLTESEMDQSREKEP